MKVYSYGLLEVRTDMSIVVDLERKLIDLVGVSRSARSGRIRILELVIVLLFSLQRRVHVIAWFVIKQNEELCMSSSFIDCFQVRYSSVCLQSECVLGITVDYKKWFVLNWRMVSFKIEFVMWDRVIQNIFQLKPQRFLSEMRTCFPQSRKFCCEKVLDIANLAQVCLGWIP